ncbi:hypothetical protein B0H16DRAFT_1585590 [Mycena metata]|uniref:F-box domain-containing protein n=1 Tax=Mycena metata TaxID=1033252 RepID=A0AAD7HYB8_9AGAR|nr:hypothetical protein B0H16DRAFT_1585590 [Mycena metata]
MFALPSLKRKRSGSHTVLEPPLKRPAFSEFLFPEPINQRQIRKRFGVSPGRQKLDKIRDRNDVARRDQWLEEFVPWNAVCFCKARNFQFCNCRGMARGTPAFDRLPAEILCHIFDMVLPSENLLDPSLHCGPNSAWCNAMATKRALVLVSRQWYNNGIAFLYRTILIRRPFDLLALRDSLTNSTLLGGLVRSITLASYFPPTWENKVYQPMERILEMCPNVKSVNNLPPFALPVRCSFPPLPPTITSIAISPHDPVEDVLDMLKKHCSRLEELSITVVHNDAFNEETLVFPHLRSLRVILRETIEDSQLALGTFTLKWDMPQLRRLAFQQVDPLYSYLPANYHPILARHGRQLEFLAFPSAPQDEVDVQHWDFGPLLTFCPMLTHVVMPNVYFISDAFTHASVRWLDHWSVDIHDASRNADRTFPHFPSLEGYRLIDCALRTLDDFPRAIDPRVRGSWRISYPGLAMEQVAAPDGLTSRLQSRDLLAADDWESSYFGAMETNAVRREQEYFDFGEGPVEHHPLWADAEDGQMPGADYVLTYWNVAEDDRPDKQWWRSSSEVRRASCWLEDETDDEESDLETEDLADLDDEFYQRKEPSPSVRANHTPTPVSPVRSSFPWFSAALHSSLFPLVL